MLPAAAGEHAAERGDIPTLGGEPPRSRAFLDAEGIEHYVSAETLDAFKTFLNRSLPSR